MPIILFSYKNCQKMGKEILKWLLIISITLVSTTLLMFVAAYIAIFNEAASYYKASISDVILLSNTFNIFYLVISPLIFPWLKRKYMIIVQVAVIMVAVGCVGRYLCKDAYNAALFWSIIVAVGHVPILTAPYGLLGMFEPSKRGYASSIPLFVPTLGINFSILYGMAYIATQLPVVGYAVYIYHIHKLNAIIAIVAVLGSAATLILLTLLKEDVKAINQESQDARNTKSCFQSLKSQFRKFKEFLFLAFAWGSILGINWTYGGMFGVFLDGTGLTHKQIALIGLYANLSSALFCNLGNWISNRSNFSNSTIIFFLNVLGFLGSLFIQASSALPQPIFHEKWALIISIIILRAGFSSFVSLSLIELDQYGPSVLVSSVFFYIANATNLLGNYLVDLLSNPKSLAIMSSSIWVCIFLVHIAQRKSIASSGVLELSTDDRKNQSIQQQLPSKNIVTNEQITSQQSQA